MNLTSLEHAKTIPDVLERLGAIQQDLEKDSPLGRHDGLACFNYLYRVITEDVYETVQSGGFENRKFLGNLDVAFANRYLDALRASVTGHRPVPRAWKVLLDRRSSESISPLRFAIAGVNAHVNLDLSHAVVNTCDHLRTPLRHGTQHADYQLVNKIFAKHMRQLRQHFESHLERSFDDRLSAVANGVGDAVVVVARDAAWMAAQALWATRKRHRSHRAVGSWIDATSSAAGHAILVPLPRMHGADAARPPAVVKS